MDIINAAKPVFEAHLASADATPGEQVLQQLEALSQIQPTIELLQTSQIGKVISRLKKATNKDVATRAAQVETSWKQQLASANPPPTPPPTPTSQSSATDSPTSASKKRKRDDTDLDSTPSETSASGEKRAKTDEAATPSSQNLNDSSSSVGQLQEETKAAAPVINKSPDRVTYTDTFAKALKLDNADPNLALSVASNIEDAIFAHFGAVNKEYKDKVKVLYLNISNKKNRQLRGRLLTLQIDATELVTMPKELLLPPERQEEIARIEEWMRGKREIGKKEATCTLYTCSKCKNNKTALTPLQTRSADEPMTIFIECVVCGHKWRD